MTDGRVDFRPYQVRAALDGRLSQTRRVLKPQPIARDVRLNGVFGITNKASFTISEDGGANYTQLANIPYSPGDRLYVREAWCTSPAYDDIKPSEMGGDESIRYAADGTWESWGWGNLGCVEGRSRPSIHMPRWASRLTLLVTDVRVQRLQEISDDDAKAEGVVSAPFPGGIRWSVAGEHDDAWLDTAREAFRGLWYRIHGPDAWDANPWVCAVSFTVHRGNIDAPMTPTPHDRKDTPDAD